LKFGSESVFDTWLCIRTDGKVGIDLVEEKGKV